MTSITEENTLTLPLLDGRIELSEMNLLDSEKHLLISPLQK